MQFTFVQLTVLSVALIKKRGVLLIAAAGIDEVPLVKVSRTVLVKIDLPLENEEFDGVFKLNATEVSAPSYYVGGCLTIGLVIVLFC